MKTKVLETNQIIHLGLNFPMRDIVKRYSKEQEIPIEVAKEHEIELKRFLILCSINKDKAYGMAGIVDELWHTFIIYTKNYLRFCKLVNGEFIHHVPVNSNKNKDPKPYLLMLKDYKKLFNEEAPKHIWPNLLNIKKNKVAGFACNACRQSCTTCKSGCGSCGQNCKSCGSACRSCSRCSK